MYGRNYWKEKGLEAGPTEKVSGLEKDLKYIWKNH